VNYFNSQRRLCAAFLLLTFFAFATFGQDTPVKDGRYFEAQGRKAYDAKDYVAFLENMKKAAELRPNHPRIMYNLAIAYALNKQSDEALKWLRAVADMGLVVPAEKDRDLESLREREEFKLVLQKIESNKAPKIRSLEAFTVHQKGLVPESVAYDESTKSFYLSSVYKRKILKIDNRGVVTDFAGEASGLWSVMGMKIDAARRLLWVCSTAHPQMENYRKEDNGSSALMKFDLRTGQLLAKYSPADKRKPHWLGDLAINAKGDVFTSDSVTPAVYVLRQGTDELKMFVEGEPFISPQGLDFTADQSKLFVADYSKGIFLVDLKSKQVTNIVADFTLLGIDGLYSYRNQLICVQNGVTPQRIVLYSLNKSLTRIDSFEVIEANNPFFDEPTLGVLVKNVFYFVANSQWASIDQNGKLAADDKLKEPLVLKLRL
jgi:sugar lactone lactonase YvrE